MQAVLWNVQKRLNSTMKPDFTYGASVDVKIKADCDMLNPVFLLHRYNVINEDGTMNYLYFNGKYYRVANIIFKDNDLVEVQCAIDVLATYKSDILGQTQLIERCSTDSNGYIVDSYAPITNRLSSFVGSSLPANPFYDSTAQSIYYRYRGFYSVGLLLGRMPETNFPTTIAQRGAVSYLAMSQIQLERLLYQLNNLRYMFSDFNPLQYITSCVFIPSKIPMTDSTFVFDILGSSETVSYSILDEEEYDYASNGILNVITNVIDFGYISSIGLADGQEYRYYEPFSQYKFNAGPFGLIDIPAACLVYPTIQQRIHARALFQINCDVATGQGELILSNNDREMMRVNGFVGVQTKLSQSSTASLTGILNTVSAALSIPANPVAGSISTITSAISNSIPRTQSMGTNDSLLAYTQWSLNAVSFSLPSTNNANVGRPLMSYKPLDSVLTGSFVKCKDVHVTNIYNATKTELEMIEDLMNTGFYIE